MVTFIHTADWQLGRPFSAFQPDTAAVLADARLTAIDRIAQVAHDEGARDVLVAGDVFDAPDVTGRMLRQPIDKLSQFQSLRWHLLPGNHDPVRPGSLWERLVHAGPPDNVTLHLTGAPIRLDTDAWLIPAPVTFGARAGDPTLPMNDVATPAGAIRIGLAHGSVRDFGDASEGLIAITRAAEARLDYLALGDWHGALSIGSRTWYSGTPEPDRFVDNEPGSVLVVRVGGAGALPQIESRPTGRFIWKKHAFPIEHEGDLKLIENEVLANAPADRLLLRLKLEGHLSIEAMAQLETWQAALEARLRHLEVDTDAIRPSASESPLHQLATGSELRAAGEWLNAIRSNPDDARRDLAEAALVRLLAYAADDAEGGLRT